MHSGMSEKQIIAGAIWLIEDGAGVFFTPTVSNLSVHSLLQFNHSSHCQESPHRPPPPSPCSTWRILCIHAATHSTHRLKQCLWHDLQFVSGLERCPSCCEQHRLHAVITSAMGLFCGDFFSFMGETPRHLAHIWSCLMRGPVCLSRNFEPTINPLHSGVVKRLQPSSPLWQKPSGVDTWIIKVCKDLRGEHLKTEQN